MPAVHSGHIPPCILAPVPWHLHRESSSFAPPSHACPRSPLFSRVHFHVFCHVFYFDLCSLYILGFDATGKKCCHLWKRDHSVPIVFITFTLHCNNYERVLKSSWNDLLTSMLAYTLNVFNCTVLIKGRSSRLPNGEHCKTDHPKQGKVRPCASWLLSEPPPLTWFFPKATAWILSETLGTLCDSWQYFNSSRLRSWETKEAGRFPGHRMLRKCDEKLHTSSCRRSWGRCEFCYN